MSWRDGVDMEIQFPTVREIVGDTFDPMEAYRRFSEWSKLIGFRRKDGRVSFVLPSKNALPRLECEVE